MTRWLTIGSTLVSIAVIGLVLLWGATGRAGSPPFEAAVLVLNGAMPLASLLLTWHLWRDGHRGAAILSSTPIILMVVVTAVALGGTVPPFSLLLWLDLYVLLVFMGVLGRFGRQVLHPTPPNPIAVLLQTYFQGGASAEDTARALHATLQSRGGGFDIVEEGTTPSHQRGMIRALKAEMGRLASQGTDSGD